jgi:anti-sigma-K factor RskA
MIPEDREELDVLAGEYVLGVLDAEAAREVEGALRINAGLRRAVAFWEERLAGLAAAANPADPPADGWERIEARLGPAMASPGPTRLWNSLALWRGAAVAAAALAACLAVVIAVPRPAAAPSLVGILRGAQPGQPEWVATAGQRGVSVSAVSPAAAPDQRVFQLWDIAPGSSRPRSLGVIGGDGRLALAQARLRDGDTLAISVEPLGGSPTGQPTGPVEFTGKLIAAG